MPLPPPGDKTAQKNTFGGFNSASIFSGQVAPTLTACPGAVATGSDVVLFSGPGRLDTLLIHPAPNSGFLNQIIFYDAATVASGGPFAASGHKIVGYFPGCVNFVSGNAPISGNINTVALGNLAGDPKQIGQPFQSGLAVNSRSGQPGFTVVWSPERPNQ